jgi:hypothetical protein
MALVWESSVVTQALVDLIEDAHVPADLKAVFYGDVALIPKVPAVAVQPGSRRRTFNQTGLQYEIVFQTLITVYHSQLSDIQDVTKDVDELAEEIEATINAARLLPDGDGAQRIIHGYISEVEPGYATRGTSLFVAHRLTHTAISRHRVGN